MVWKIANLFYLCNIQPLWNLCYSYNNLPWVGRCKHIQINLNIKKMSSWSPSNIAHNFFPIIMASVCSSVIIWKYHMWPMQIMWPRPRNFRSVSMSKFCLLFCFETIWCSLKSSGYKKFFCRNQILRMNMFDYYISRNQWKSYFL